LLVFVETDICSGVAI